MKFEIRAISEKYAVGAPLALAVKNGPIIPGQASSDLQYASDAGSLSTLTITFKVGIPDLPLHIVADDRPWPQDLQAASAAFAALSWENKRRFVAMYAGQLPSPYPYPR